MAWFKRKSFAQKQRERQTKEATKEERRIWLAGLRKEELQKRRESYKAERLKIATERGRRKGQPFSQKMQRFAGSLQQIAPARKTVARRREPSQSEFGGSMLGSPIGTQIKKTRTKRKPIRRIKRRSSTKTRYTIIRGKAYPVG